MHEPSARPPLAVRLLQPFGVAAFAILIGSTLLGAIARYFSLSNVEWSFEVAGIAFIWVIFLGTIIAEINRHNVGFEWLVLRAGARVRWALSLFANLVLLATTGILAWSSVLLVMRTLPIPTPVLRTSSAISPIALALCAFALVLVALMRIVQSFRQIPRRDDAL